MNFKQKPQDKQYSISFKTTKGNTVGFLNLGDAFIKAVTGKSPYEVTAEDILAINKGDFDNYIRSLAINVEAKEEDTVIEATDY